MADQAILYDASKCTGCRGCQVACKQWNGLPADKTEFWGTYENPRTLTGNTWTKINFREKRENGQVKFLFAKVQCMHCTNPSCEAVCAAGAAKKNVTTGLVQIDQNRCIGCKNCATACPFGAANFSEETGTSRKCRGCPERVAAGMEPACVSTCVTGALSFGARSEIISKAKARQRELQADGKKAVVYGEHEVGGLRTIYVLEDEPEAYGLPGNPQIATATVAATWAGVGVAAGLLALIPFKSFFEARERGLKEAREKSLKGGKG